jgi:WASH complex subunit 7
MAGRAALESSPFSEVDAQLQPIEEQLQRGLAFVQNHTVQLQQIEDKVNNTISEIWDSAKDPIYVHMQPPEKVDVQDLITTHNELFNKVLTVFAVLCDEICELKMTAETNFYPALVMFGVHPDDGEEELKAGEEEMQLVRLTAPAARTAHALFSSLEMLRTYTPTRTRTT